MSKSLEALDNIAVYSALHNGVLDSSVIVLDKSVKALKILKKYIHIEKDLNGHIYLTFTGADANQDLSEIDQNKETEEILKGVLN